ncbi:MAG: pyridoxamine 5'-phosphate oxidase family protein [Candidatus Limnocylindria bacterium]
MITWSRFEAESPHVAEIFRRRHRAAANLCFLATLRADGFPRISPMEPRIFEDHLVLVGMPGTNKFRDLARDPRFSLHTASIDPNVGDGDAKVWGLAAHLDDADFQVRWAESVFQESGYDLRGQRFDPFYVADLRGASSLEVVDDALRITIWKPGEGERVVEKT